MTQRASRTVLISEPHALESVAPFFPYMWAVLKSYWERHAEAPEDYEWLDPVFRNDRPAALLEPYRDTRIDVLGLSCYQWNWKLQCAIAREVKARHPACVVVAGGPEPAYKDPDFFRKHPYIDVIAVLDGEIAFTRILSELQRSDCELTRIAGLYLPGVDGGGHRHTGRAEVPSVFDHSPYVDQTAFYQRLLDRHGPGHFYAIWETNRGCPYACSFCDWGSNEVSRVRRFDDARVDAEVEWLCRMQVGMIFGADANFGLLPRDVEIADRVNECFLKYGYPKYLYYSAAKNRPDRSVAIAKKFAETGISPTHTLAIQHTRPEVLAATDRSNISPERQIQVAKELIAAGIPLDVQLIVGIPGDSYELWKGCLADLMEWAIHEDYYAFIYHVLPNAPAADPHFVEQWQVGTIERIVFSGPQIPKKREKFDPDRMTPGKLVVESKTYTREDWARCFVYAMFVKALHNASVTRLISVYLRLTHGVSYLEFYEAVIEDFLARRGGADGLYAVILEHYHDFLTHPDATDHIEVEQLPRLGFPLDPSRWIFVQIAYRLEAFFDELRRYLLERFPDATHLESVIEYQSNLIILPSYDPDAGKRFATDLDWVSYFEAAKGRAGYEVLAEPGDAFGSVVEVSDQSCGEKNYLVSSLRFGEDEEQRAHAWIQNSVLIRNSAARRNFQRLRLRRSSRLGHWIESLHRERQRWL